jgi:neurotransmitter:Na+ symporter, NSS family
VRAALDALGFGFLSIGVGLSLMVTYAVYTAADTELQNVTIVTIACDTVVSIVASFAIFPIVFACRARPGWRAGFMFVTLPLASVPRPLRLFRSVPADASGARAASSRTDDRTRP